MSTSHPEFSLGIEEEYLLVDLDTCDLVSDPPDELFERCKAKLGARVMPEFLRSQIEVGTGVCRTVAQARSELAELRATIAEVAKGFNAAPIAASTHPFAKWQAQQHTDKDRYNVLAFDMQVVVRRLLISGMHIHVGIAPDDLRIDLMNQVCYFLSHLLAMSTSSPFWQGEITGLKAYRLAVFDELPRTGLPATFTSFGEYLRNVEVLVGAGLIEDASKFWWDLRPHHKFPTLEMRLTDVCTLVEDTATIAAAYQCLLRMLYRLRRDNQRWRTYGQVLLNENRWRAQRYGMDEGLVDFGKGKVVAFAELVEELITLLGEDADALGCTDELLHMRTIVARGTSADRQLKIYHAAISGGVVRDDALRMVVRHLIGETVQGDA